ncbi:MAG: MaoC/PaaZ C-terminal domain-containing protein [Archaeoglobales archaeon]|nr:MaoC/PaaZ C-terminal domain-containing protein [Archaeoglobales archaeon]
MNYFFEDFEVGMRFESPARTITEADVVMFAALSGDWNPIHVDAEYAKDTIFGKRIAHGLLTLSIAAGLLTRLRLTEKTIVAFYGIEKLRFTKPVFIGDTIKAVMEVLEKEEKSGKDYGVVSYDVKVYNQNNEVVLTYIAKVAVMSKFAQRK